MRSRATRDDPPDRTPPSGFDHHGFRLEVALAHTTTYVLALPELAGRLRPDECSMRVPAKGSRRVLLQLAKEDASSTWRKLTAM